MTTEIQQPKWIGTSKTFWGTAITAVSAFGPVVGPLLGWNIQAADVQAAGDAIWNVVQAGGMAVGTIMAIWGRMTAKGPATAM